ncbi:MAG TPA: TonB-dependent receptor [Vicinamibacteria bacterium]|nr:TonB-dependent receptor [Vicinamibacteria bacterium]
MITLVAAASFATADLAGVSGRITDARGGSLPRAVVTLRAGGEIFEARSDPDGRFALASVPAGAATLVVEAAGYAALRRGVHLSDGLVLELVLERLGFAEELTVTAARTISSQADTPASVVVLSRQDLLATPAVALDDALRQVPGFSLFRRTGSRVANPTTQGAFLRGVGASGASRALVLEDGIPINDAFGGWVQWGRVPRAALGRVEVLRGGASDVHGSGALAGVVHLVRQPVERGTLLVDSSYGGQGTAQVSLLAGGRAGRWAAALAAESFTTDGYLVLDAAARGPVDVRADSRYTTVDLSLERALAPGARAFVRGHAFDESRGNGTPLQTNATDLRELRLGADGHVGQGAFSFRAHAGDQAYDQTFTAIAADRARETLTRSQHVPADSAGVSGHWRQAFGTRVVVAGGASVRRVSGLSEEDAFTRPGAPPVRTRAGGRQRDLAAFLEAMARPHGRLTVSAAARLDAWRNEPAGDAAAASARREQALSPRLSLLWRPRGDVAVSAAGYRAFRAPSLNELYRPFRVGNVLTLANDALGAERLGGLEAGVRLARGAGAMRATAFWMQAEQTVGNVTLSATPALITRQRRNLGKSRSRGLELDVEWRPSGALSVSGGYLLADATVRDFQADPSLQGLRVPQVPRHQVTLQSRWRAPHGLRVSAQARWSGAQYDDDRNQFELGSFWALDGLVSRPFGRRLELFAAVENLTGERWDVGRTPLRTVGPPRSIRGGLRIELTLPR